MEDRQERTPLKKENIGFNQIINNQISRITDAFTFIRSDGNVNFSTNVISIQDSIEALESLLVKFLDKEYYKTKKNIENKPYFKFEDVYIERLKRTSKFDLNAQDEIEQNRTLYYDRKKMERLREIFRAIIKWCAKNKLLFDKDPDVKV